MITTLMTEQQICEEILNYISSPKGIGAIPAAREEYKPLVAKAVEWTIQQYPDTYIII